MVRSTNAFRTGSGAAGARIVWYEDTLTPGLEALPSFVDDMVSTVFRYYESQVENSARQNAPWTDRTSNARNGLIAQSGTEGKTHFLVLAHRVDYGIWLEVANGGRYAIIMPTIEQFAPEIMGRLEGMLARFGGGFSRG